MRGVCVLLLDVRLIVRMRLPPPPPPPPIFTGAVFRRGVYTHTYTQTEHTTHRALHGLELLEDRLELQVQGVPAQVQGNVGLALVTAVCVGRGGWIG
jgi:hypothetical protein